MLRKNASLKSVAKETNAKALDAYKQWWSISEYLMRLDWCDTRRREIEATQTVSRQKFEDLEEIGKHLCRLAGIEWEDPRQVRFY